jgi:hypothetical protein
MKLNADFDKYAEETRMKTLKYATQAMRETGRNVDVATMEMISKIKKDLDEGEAKAKRDLPAHQISSTQGGQLSRIRCPSPHTRPTPPHPTYIFMFQWEILICPTF